jgi:hypothetical protein
MLTMTCGAKSATGDLRQQLTAKTDAEKRQPLLHPSPYTLLKLAQIRKMTFIVNPHGPTENNHRIRFRNSFISIRMTQNPLDPAPIQTTSDQAGRHQRIILNDNKHGKTFLSFHSVGVTREVKSKAFDLPHVTCR